jgi:hypothetical protein
MTTLADMWTGALVSWLSESHSGRRLTQLAEYSLYCDATARCVVNEANSHVGCCKDLETSCPVWTKCYDSTDSDSYTTSNGRTMWWYVDPQPV